MVRIRQEDVEDLDVEELDAIEYSTEQFDSYDGEVPPKDIELLGYVKKMWWTRSQAGDPMLKILWVAADNEGEEEEFNDCPFWLNYALNGGSKFRWAPFLDNYGITLKQIKKREIDLADKDDQNGAPINKIGSFKPGEENDEAWCRIITGSERYQGDPKPAIAEWLPYDADDDDQEPDDDEPEEDEEDEPEPEPEPEPARGRGRTASRSPARSAPVKAETPPARRGTRAARSEPEKPAPARGPRSPRAASVETKTRAAATKPARGRGRRSSDDNEPPF